MQLSSIDMQEIGRLLFGPATRYEGKPRCFLQGMNIHRFALEEDNADFDRVHVLVDGSGSYAVIEHPGTEKVTVPRKGYLSEFAKALAKN